MTDETIVVKTREDHAVENSIREAEKAIWAWQRGEIDRYEAAERIKEAFPIF